MIVVLNKKLYEKLFLTIVLSAAAAAGAFSQVKGLSVSRLSILYPARRSHLLGATVNTTIPLADFMQEQIILLLHWVRALPSAPACISLMHPIPIKTILIFKGKKADGIPVNFSYKFNLVPKTLAISPYLGPTFSIGLSKKSTADKWSNTANLYSDDFHYGRFNLALGGGIALDIVDMIRVTFGYNQYLLDAYTGDNDVKYKRNNAVHFGVAYIF